MENLRKPLEVAWTFSEMPVMTRQQSQAFDVEKVGRCTKLWNEAVLTITHARNSTVQVCVTGCSFSIRDRRILGLRCRILLPMFGS